MIPRTAALRVLARGGFLMVTLVAPSAAQSRSLIQPEVRVDVLTGTHTTAHLGAGMSFPAGTYVRFSTVAGAGVVWYDDDPQASARLDATARFVFDPLRQSRWALYGAGGLGALYDAKAELRGRLLVFIGLEGPRWRGSVPAFEVGLGEGARLAIVFRRALRDRR